jgi:hypothetical protein
MHLKKMNQIPLKSNKQKNPESKTGFNQSLDLVLNCFRFELSRFINGSFSFGVDANDFKKENTVDR